MNDELTILIDRILENLNKISFDTKSHEIVENISLAESMLLDNEYEDPEDEEFPLSHDDLFSFFNGMQIPVLTKFRELKVRRNEVREYLNDKLFNKDYLPNIERLKEEIARDLDLIISNELISSNSKATNELKKYFSSHFDYYKFVNSLKEVYLLGLFPCGIKSYPSYQSWYCLDPYKI